jgi:hypothetical protein
MGKSTRSRSRHPPAVSEKAYQSLRAAGHETHLVDSLLERDPSLRHLRAKVRRLRVAVERSITDRRAWVRYEDTRLAHAAAREERMFDLGCSYGLREGIARSRELGGDRRLRGLRRALWISIRCARVSERIAANAILQILGSIVLGSPVGGRRRPARK